MSPPLVFMMGQAPAFLPTDRVYAKNHMWAVAVEGGYRFGLSAYAVRLLGEMRHVKWSVAEGTMIRRGQPVGYVEASKATSDLYTPMSGVFVQRNENVVADPKLINSDLYEAAWLFRITGGGETFLSPHEYLTHVETSWPLAQRMLKAQVSNPKNRD